MKKDQDQPTMQDQPRVAPVVEQLPAPEAPALPDQDAAAEAPSPDQQLAALEREAADWRDRALRAAADLDNYRKRAARERDETALRSQAEVLARVLEVVDDLARVAHLDPGTTSAAALHEGMLQIERKFLKVLETAGVERVDPAGQPFDPQLHEAVTMMPAAGPEADHTVGTVLQHGYRFRGTLLRPARVAVLSWTPPADAGGVS
jgi:molecular chaperone GrpE